MGWGDPIRGTRTERLRAAAVRVDQAGAAWRRTRSMADQQALDEALDALADVLSASSTDRETESG